MKVSDIGEFGLIDVLSQVVATDRPQPQVTVGPGDDAAAWQVEASTLLATTDTMVEGIHFSPESEWWHVGWKSLASNLSDIAAMGGSPRYALASLSLPDDTDVDDMVRLCQGIKHLGDIFGVMVVGGNVTRAPLVVITLMVVGQALAEGVMTRSAAAPGDLLAVTGHLGSSAAGLRALTAGVEMPASTREHVVGAHLQPWPRIAEGQLLVRQGVRAAIDISDGLGSDLGHLCRASNAGAEVSLDRLPIHPAVREAFPEEAVGLAVGGGEDYELLFAAGPEVMDRVLAAAGGRQGEKDCPITVIGRITAESGVSLVDAEGGPVQGLGAGWDHFRKGG